MIYSEEDKADLKQRHVGDLRTLWKIYNIEQPYYKAPYLKTTGIISLAIVMTVAISHSTFLSVIELITSHSLSILPSLLGFNLGAYILVVGFASTDILKDITEPLENKGRYSLYQQLNGILAVSVLFQIFCLIIFFVCGILIEIDFPTPFSNLNIRIFNGVVLWVLSGGLLYSIFLLISVVKHVFLFSQTIHFCITVDKINENMKSKTLKNPKN